MTYLYQKIGTTGYGKTKSIKIAQTLLDSNCEELCYEKVIPHHHIYHWSHIHAVCMC